MSEERKNSISSCDASGFVTSINIISNEEDCIYDAGAISFKETQEARDHSINIHSVPSALSLCAMGDKWRNSQLSVHSMMVTDEEKYSYMGSSNSICSGKEETNCSKKNTLVQYKNNYGLSSTNCIDTTAVEVKTKSKIKEDFEDFSNSIVNVPKHSKMVKNKAKKHSNSSKLNSTRKLSSTSDECKTTLFDMKHLKKKRRNSAQAGIILDVALLHDTDIISKKKNSKIRNSHNSSEDSEPKSSSRVTGSDNKQRLSPSILMTPCSPSPSIKSDDGGGSDTSSVYHSTYFTPSENCKSSDVASSEINKIPSPLVKTPLRAQSALGCSDSKEFLSSSSNLKTRRASAVAEDFFRSSLPYIPRENALPDLEKKTLKVSDLNLNEFKDREMLCMPQWGNVCGGSGPEQKDINDQTCRSNFGMVLSGLCFILFLWYLGVVYSRFIREALHLDAIDSLLTPTEPEIIQEVVINISANDFRLFSN